MAHSAKSLLALCSQVRNQSKDSQHVAVLSHDCTSLVYHHVWAARAPDLEPFRDTVQTGDQLVMCSVNAGFVPAVARISAQGGRRIHFGGADELDPRDHVEDVSVPISRLLVDTAILRQAALRVASGALESEVIELRVSETLMDTSGDRVHPEFKASIILFAGV